jgi:RNA polymerase sigma-70 factor (ECF subfamily)
VGTLTDEAIWARVVAGEAREFGDIWDRHCDRVLAYLVRLTGSKEDAEDLTAITFLELWRGRGRVRFVDGSLLPWLMVTARHVHSNAARSRRRHRAMLAKLPPATSTSPLEPLVDPRTELVAGILGSCRGPDKDLMLLTAVEGFTVAEAAKALGMSEPAARMRLSRLRTTIRSAVTAATSLEGGTS